MTLVFDTSVLIAIERKDRRVLDKLAELHEAYPAPGSVGFMNYFEFIYGLSMKQSKKRIQLMSFIERFNLLATTKNTARIMSLLRRRYESKGQMFSLADLLIASQVIENNMILLTKDKRFEAIEELTTVLV